MGRICNIQGYTIHDGPGIRTEIFFEGCPMSCLWCSNPESQGTSPRLGLYPSKCITEKLCGYCTAACPEKEQLIFNESGLLADIRDTEKCRDCYRCAEACPADAIKLWGYKVTVDDLMKVILRDRSYYEKTGGGVTISGGEIMQQWEFARELLKTCKEAGINTCAESALFCSPEHMKAVFEYADLIIADIKHMDSAVHKKLTGVPVEPILENLRIASRLGKPMVIRTPTVMGYNDSDENILETARFIKEELGSAVIQYQLLPYRKMGTEKYEALRLTYPMGDYVPPERTQWEPRLLHLVDIVKEKYALPIVAGTAGKLPIEK